MKIAKEGERKQWRCDGCGKIDYWGDNWSWYGSYLGFENNGRKGIKVVCSDSCKGKINTGEVANR